MQPIHMGLRELTTCEFHVPGLGKSGYGCPEKRIHVSPWFGAESIFRLTPVQWHVATCHVYTPKRTEIHNENSRN